jgi:O-succinylbenzoic acid--CoA ligase
MTVRDKQPLDQMLAGCTHASLVPTQLWRLLVNNTPVTLKAVLLGGAAIPVELTEQAREQGIRCWCGYGLTEFASTVCAKEADGLADVGSALPGRKSGSLMTKFGYEPPAWRKVTGVTDSLCL